MQALEPRVLLSGTEPQALGPVALQVVQESALSTQAVAALKGGLTGLADFLTQVGAVDRLAIKLPIVERSIGAAHDAGTTFRTAVVDAITAYLNGTGAPTVEGLRGVLSGLANVTAVTGTSGASEILFGLTLNVAKPLGAVPLSLGTAANDLGISNTGTVSPTSNLRFAFSFGFDTAAGLSAEDAFFIRVTELTNDVVISTTGQNFGVNVGLLAGTATNASVALNGKVAVTIANPNNDAAGRITLKELRTTAFSALVGMTAPTSTISGELPISASFGGWTATGSPALVLGGNPLAGTLTLTPNPAFAEVQNFSTITQGGVIQVLGQVATKLSSISRSALMGTDVPFLGGRSIGDIVDLGAIFQAAVVTPLTDANGVPTFQNFASFTSVLASALGVNQSALNGTYNAATNELSFQITLARVMAPTSLDIDLGAVINGSTAFQGFTVLSDDSSATVNASGDATFKLVMNLTPPIAVATASGALPVNGRLASPQNFSLSLNGGALVNLTINPDATNNLAADLVTDINTALNATTLKGKVIASLSSGRLQFSTATFGSSASLMVGAPAVNELGLITMQPVQSLTRQTFLEAPALSAGVTANAATLNGTASIGYLGLLIRGGNASSSATTSLALKPGNTRLAVLDPLAADVNTVFDKTVGGTANASINVRTNGRGFFETLSPNAAANIVWTNIANPAALNTTFTSEFAPLLKFGSLTFAQIDTALTTVRDQLAALQTLPELNTIFPLTDDAFSTLIDLTTAFDSMLASVRAAAPKTVQDLQRLMDLGMGDAGTAPTLLGNSAVIVNYDAATNVVFIDLSLVRNVHSDSPLSLDLLPLGAANVTTLSDFNGGDPLSVDASAKFRMKLGVDLTGASPVAYLYDDSALEFGAKVGNTDLDLSFLAGPLNFIVKDGTVAIDDGTPAKGPAKVIASMTDRGANGRYAMSEIDDAGVFAAATIGKLSAQLPVYESNGTTYVGDLALNSTPDFLANSFVGQSANTASLIAQRIANSNPNSNITSFNQGWVSFMTQLNTLFTNFVANSPLPIAGNLQASVLGFLSNLQNTVTNELINGAPQTSAAIKPLIFNAVGPAGLGWLADTNNSGTVTQDDVILSVLSDEFTFRMRLEPNYPATNPDGTARLHTITIPGVPAIPAIPSIGGSPAIPASPAIAPRTITNLIPLANLIPNNPVLGFTNAFASVGFKAVFDFKFGVSLAEGFFIDTAVTDELQIDVEVALPKAAPGVNQFLNVAMNGFVGRVSTDNSLPASELTRINFGVKVDLRDPVDPSGINDHRLSFNDMRRYSRNLDTIKNAFNVKVHGDIKLRLIFEAGYRDLDALPALAVNFNFDWVFDATIQRGTAIDTLQNFLAQTTLPTLSFTNFRMSAGDVFEDFVDPVLAKMTEILTPLRPVIDALNKKVDALNDNQYLRDVFDLNHDGTVRVLDLLRISSLGGNLAPIPEGAFKFIDAVIAIDSFSRAVPKIPESIPIVFPDISVGSVDLRFNGLSSVLPTLLNSPNLTPAQQFAAISSANSFFNATLSITDVGEGFKYLLFDELNAGKMLFGQTVDIFSYDLPTLQLGFAFEKDIPVSGVPPVFLAFGGDLSAYAHVKFGYDTHGLSTGNPIDGLWLAADPGKPIFGLKGSLFGAVGLGVAGLAEVRGELRFAAKADFTLNDPDGDNKLHYDEFGGAPTPFNITGRIWAEANIIAKLVGNELFRFESPKFTFWEAKNSIPSPSASAVRLPDRLEGTAGNNTKATAATIGVGPGVHLRGASIGTFGDVDWYKFEVTRGVDALDIKVGSALVDVEVIDAAGNSVGFARTKSATDVVTLGNVGEGTYYIRVFSSTGAPAAYSLDIDPSKSSAQKVYYVNAATVTDATKDSYYTTGPGLVFDPQNPNNEIGKGHGIPAASVDDIFTRFNVNLGDIIVVDSGTYTDVAVIAGSGGGGDDEGFVLAGAPGFRTIWSAGANQTALTFNNVGNSIDLPGESAIVTDLRFATNTGALRLNQSEANIFRRLDFVTATFAVDLNQSHRNDFSEITIADANNGVRFVGSDENVFKGTLNAVAGGLLITDSDANDFTGTTISANVVGASLLRATNTTLQQLTITSTGVGVRLTGSGTNMIDQTMITASGGAELILEADGANPSTDNVIKNSTFENATITAGNTLVQGNTVAGRITLTGGALNQIKNNIVGNGIVLDGTATVTVMTNTVTGGISITRGASNIIDGNTLTGGSGIAISGGDLLNVRNNTITGAFAGISIGTAPAVGLTPADPADGVVNNNTLTNGLRGVTFDTTDNSGVEVRYNTITGMSGFGVYAPANAQVHHNTIAQGGIGIFYGGTSNSVFANDVHHNSVGLTGTGLLGHAGWVPGIDPNDIHDNAVGIDVPQGATVQFNRVRNNSIGIRAADGSSIHHNVLFGNTAQSILVSGGDNVSIVHNTIVATTGDAVRVVGNSTGVALRNNIIWAQAGYALYVATDSQTGFASDYNNLFTSGTGKLVWYQKDFLDLFDWQVEADYDTHSIGYTTIATTLDNPMFVDAAASNFRLASASTSIDAADPASSFASEPGTNGARADLGAYGNTNLATASRTAYLQLLYPTYYTDWEVAEANTIRWRDYDSAGIQNRLAGTVGIELHQVGTGKIRDLGVVPISDGQFAWTPDAALVNTTARYFIKLVPTALASAAETQRETFAVPIIGNNFYVDDASNSNDEFTPGAIGNNRNTGKTAGDPKANPLPIVHNYQLTANQTVHIDTGNYMVVRDLRFSGDVASGFGDDEGMTITGPTDPAKVATLDRAKTIQNAHVIELRDADLVTVSHLTLVGAVRGLWVHQGSESFSGTYLTVSGHVKEGLLIGEGQYGYEQVPSLASSLSHLTAFNNGASGIVIGSTSGALHFDNINVHHNAGHGLYIGTRVASLTNSTAHDNLYDGFNLADSSSFGGTSRIEGNTAYNNQTGFYVTYNATVGNADLSLGKGNVVYDNRYTGIYAGSNATVVGNHVYGQSSNGGIGIRGGLASFNVVHHNYVGIDDAGASFNRVYANTTVGIKGGGLGNVVYSNAVGMDTDGFYSGSGGTVEGNLVYANSTTGIVVRYTSGGQFAPLNIRGNTVYQPTGNALEFIGSSYATVSDNILWSGGTALSLDIPSQQNFKSDNNLFFTSGTGKVGTWQGAVRSTFAQWKNATFGDKNSIFADPLFVDRDGADNALGYVSAAQDGRDDDFHLQSTFGSVHGASLAPVLGANGLPAMQAGTMVNDAAQSPAIDRADFNRPFANELVNNGGYADLGAYGNTAQASRSPAQYVLVTSPDGGDVFPRKQTFAINWRSHDTKHNPFNPPDAGNVVDVVLFKNGAQVATLASGTPNDGQFLWTVPDDLAIGADYTVRVTHTLSAKLDTSNAPFEVTPAISIYYVNDGTIGAGEWTTAPGDNSNDGLTPATPKADIRAVLETYDLGENDVIRVDAGVFELTQNIIITNADSGVTIVGFNDAAQPGKYALIDRNLESSGAYAFELQDADNLTITNLRITGGYAGIYGGQAFGNEGSAALLVRDSVIFGNGSYAIDLRSGNFGATLVGNEFYGVATGVYFGTTYYNQTSGVRIEANDATVSSNTFRDGSGFETAGRNVVVENNQFTAARLNSSGGGFGSAQTGTIFRNNTLTGRFAYISATAGVLVQNNTVSASNYGYGIYAAGHFSVPEEMPRVIGNTVFGITGQGVGIQLSGAYASGNVVYDNIIGIGGSGTIENNRVFHNSGVGIDASGTLRGNVVYSNNVGIQSGGLVTNNLIYANTATGLEAESGADVINNTIHQPTGSAVKVVGFSSSEVTLKNNILSTGAAAGTAIFVEANNPIRFASDYNLFTGPGAIAKWLGATITTQTQWSLEIGFDRHSILGAPGFIDPDGADDVLGYTTLDGGADDNFRLVGSSIATDAGDPTSPFLGEPAPNGLRANIGYTGNSVLANASGTQTIQILGPAGLDRLIAGRTVSIDWRSSGLAQTQSLVQTHSGATTAIDGWSYASYLTHLPSLGSITEPIDLSSVNDAAPASVYANFWQGDYNSEPNDGGLHFNIPVPDGTYTLRLHFVEYEDEYDGRNRKMNIVANGTTLATNFNIQTEAGGRLKAIAKTFTVTAANGSGIDLDLGAAGSRALLSGLELAAVNPSGFASATVNLEVSTNGGASWSPIASNVPLGTNGAGSYAWTPDNALAGMNALLRIKANAGTQPTDLSDRAFQIAAAGNEFFINNGIDANDIVTTAAGNNENSGRERSKPMASLSALLAAYDLQPGDTIFLDAGTYTLATNIVITGDDAGIRIVGAPGFTTVLDRNAGQNGFDASTFELRNADGVELTGLKITGGYRGIYAPEKSDSDGIKITGNLIVENQQIGVEFETSNDHALITGNTFFGRHDDNAGAQSNYSNNQPDGIETGGLNTTIRGNTLTQVLEANPFSSYTGGTGIELSGGFALIENNTVRNYSTGISGSTFGAILGETIIHDNQVSLNASGITANSGRVLVTGNTVHDNEQAGISAYSSQFTISVIVENNTIFGHDDDDFDQGLVISDGVIARNNVIHSNAIGVYAYGGELRGNRIFANTIRGVQAVNDAVITENTIYSNASGIFATYYLTNNFPNFFAGTISNNAVYDSSVAGIELSGAQSAKVLNNTLHQAGGIGVKLTGTSFDVFFQGVYNRTQDVETSDLDLRNNIFSVGTGVGISSDAFAQRDIHSDYNLFSLAGGGRVGTWQGAQIASLPQWFYEVGLDEHSLVGSPGFVNPAGADGILGFRNGNDFGADDNFHVTANSLTVDAGDPASYYFGEPSPNGDRVNLGRYGNTLETPASFDQSVIVVGPAGFAKVEAGVPTTIRWTTSGLTPTKTFLRMNTGGGTVGAWGYNAFQTTPGYQQKLIDFNTGNLIPVNRSGVIDPAPEIVYQTFSQSFSDVGDTLSYHLDLPNGTYSLRLHFVEPELANGQYFGVGTRLFDIVGNGEMLEEDFDIFARAGGGRKALAESFDIVVNGGNGFDLSLVTKNQYWSAILAGLEITRDNPLGEPNPTVDLEFSTNNGSSWTSLATNVALDAEGNGSLAWTPPAALEGQNVMVRVTAKNDAFTDGVSAPFALVNSGANFYLNDGALTGDVHTTAIGNDANSGKDAAHPMRTLAALLDAYDLDPGDRIFVDAGTYNLLRNVTIGAGDSGVEIIGPAGAAAIFNRGNTSVSTAHAFEITGATNVTIGSVSITGAHTGLFAGSGSTGLLIKDSAVFGNYRNGALIDSGATFATIRNTTIYGVPGGTATDNQDIGVLVRGADATIENSTLRDHAKYGVSFLSNMNEDMERGRVLGNTVFNNADTGIRISGYVPSLAEGLTISGNTIYGNTKVGIYSDGQARISGNTVRDHLGVGAIGIHATAGEVRGNVISKNETGVRTSPISGGGFFGVSTLVAGNRIFANTISGILSGGGTFDGNQIYSNSIGIDGQGTMTNNLIYANSNHAIVVSFGGATITNNTIRQVVGDAVRLGGQFSSVSATILNNILWVDAGYAINQGSGSSATSDYNVFNLSTAVNARIGFSSGTDRDELADWQTATGQDAHSIFGDPKFIDEDGADNILGYTILAGNPVDGGLDDNFHLGRNSPAIDRGHALLGAGADRDGVVRRDDPATANNGSEDYVISIPANSAFAKTGTQLNFSGGFNSPLSANASLSFSFPFFGQNYSYAYVSPNGFLGFSGSTGFDDKTNSTAELARSQRIAPLWDDFTTSVSSVKAFQDSSVLNEHTIRWEVTRVLPNATTQQLDFSVTLFASGDIRFNYGDGLTGLSPTIGISNGNGFMKLASQNGAASIATGNRALFALTAGASVTDIGAFEFAGSSSDATAPTVASTVPAIIHTGGFHGVPFDRLTVKFSEIVDHIDASAALNYALVRDADGNGQFNGSDEVFTLTPLHTPGSDSVVLISDSGVLPVGNYRLTITGNRLHDTAGNLLAQYEKTFTVNRHGVEVSTTALVVNESGTVQFGVRLRELPTGNTTVNVALSGDSNLSITGGATLNFTIANWNVFQTVTVAAANDADGDNGTATITASASGWTSDSLTATEADDDRALVLSTNVVTAGEESFTQTTVGVKLAAQPASDIVVNVSRTNGDSSLRVSGESVLIFTPQNWDTLQNVTIFADNDLDAIDGVANFSATADGWTGATFTATEADDDRELENSNFFSSVDVAKGAIVTYTVRLKGLPASDVVVTTAKVAGGDAKMTLVNGGSLTFTPENWNIPQTVTLQVPANAEFRQDDTFRSTATNWEETDARFRVFPPAGTIVVDPNITLNLTKDQPFTTSFYPERPERSGGGAITITVTQLPANVTILTGFDNSTLAVGSTIDPFYFFFGFNAKPFGGFSGNGGIFEYTVTDGNNQTATQQISFNVTRFNFAPTVGGNFGMTLPQDSAPTFLNLSAPSDADNDPLTITVTSVPTAGKGEIRLGQNGAVVALNSTLTQAQVTTLYFAPVAGAFGAAGAFTMSVTDGIATVARTITFTLTQDVNDAPFAQDDKTLIATDSGNTALGIFQPFDSDGDPLTVTITAVPSVDVGVVKLGTTTITTASTVTTAELAQLVFTPATGAAGTSGAFSYSVSDGELGDSQTVTIQVAQAVTFDKTNPLIFTDSSGDQLVLTLAGAGSGKVIFTGAVGASDIHTVLLSDTASASALKLAFAKGNSGAGLTTVAHIATTGQAQSLGKVELVEGVTLGDGTSGTSALYVSGAISTLTLDDVAANAGIYFGDDISDAAQRAKLKPKITLGDVGQNADLTSAGGIGSLLIGSWPQNGYISARFTIGKVEVLGPFGASIYANDFDSNANPVSLGAVKVAGDFTGDLYVEQAITSVTVNGMIRSGAYFSAATIGKITATSFDSATFMAVGEIDVVTASGGAIKSVGINAGFAKGLVVKLAKQGANLSGIENVNVFAGGIGSITSTLKGLPAVTALTAIRNSTFTATTAAGIGNITGAVVGDALVFGNGLDAVTINSAGDLGKVTGLAASKLAASFLIGIRNTGATVAGDIGAITASAINAAKEPTGTTGTTGGIVSTLTSVRTFAAGGAIGSIKALAQGAPGANEGIATFSTSRVAFTAGTSIKELAVTAATHKAAPTANTYALSNVNLTAGTTISKIAIGGDATAAQATQFRVNAGGAIGSLTISSKSDGSFGSLVNSTILAGQDAVLLKKADLAKAGIGSVKISGAIIGASAVSPTVIAAKGNLGAIVIGGNVQNTIFVAGAAAGGDGVLNAGDTYNRNASITAVKIAGALSASTITAGINPGADFKWGNVDDVLGTDLSLGALAKVGAVSVGLTTVAPGTTDPLPSSTTFAHDFAIESIELKSVQIGKLAAVKNFTGLSFWIDANNDATAQPTEIRIRLVQ